MTHLCLQITLTITGRIRVVITANGVSLYSALIKFLIQVYTEIKNGNANKYTTVKLMAESQHCCSNNVTNKACHSWPKFAVFIIMTAEGSELIQLSQVMKVRECHWIMRWWLTVTILRLQRRIDEHVDVG